MGRSERGRGAPLMGSTEESRDYRLSGSVSSIAVRACSVAFCNFAKRSPSRGSAAIRSCREAWAMGYGPF